MKTGSKMRLQRSQATNGARDMSPQLITSHRLSIGEIAFGVVPDALIRIEFGCIGREKFEMHVRVL